MNLPAAHIEQIKDLGYTDSEARFLYIVAVFSGYFTLGQFRAFTGSMYGKRATSFAQKLLKQGHATVRDYLRRGSIYHLFSRTSKQSAPGSSLSQSEHDWAYAKRALARGDDPEEIIRRITDYRGDEKHANYARHTVEKAQRQLKGVSGLQHSRGNLSTFADEADRQQ